MKDHSSDFSESFYATLAGDGGDSMKWPMGIRQTHTPEEAELFLVPIPSFLLCKVAGWEDRRSRPPKWAQLKMVMTTPCPAYQHAIEWVEKTHFFQENPQVHSRHLIYLNTWATDQFPHAVHRASDKGRLASYIHKSPLLSKAIVLTEEDRTNTPSKFLSVPYYLGNMWTSPLGNCEELGRMASRPRPHLVCFIGSLVQQTMTKNKCPFCPQEQNGYEIRSHLVQSLVSGAKDDEEVSLSVFGMPDTDQAHLSTRAKEMLRQNQQLSDADVREKMLDSTFCMIPRGDTASSRRMYCAILTLCIPVVVSDHFDFPFRSDPSIDALYREGVILFKEHDVAHDPSFDTLEALRTIDDMEIQGRRKALLNLQPTVSFYKSRPPSGEECGVPTTGVIAGASATAALLREASSMLLAGATGE